MVNPNVDAPSSQIAVNNTSHPSRATRMTVVHVVLHLINVDDNAARDGATRLYDLVPAFARRTERARERSEIAFELVGQCNDTHRVTYSLPVAYGGREPAGAVHVYQAWSNDKAPNVLGERLSQINLLHTMEMYDHIGFKAADGFRGIVALDRHDPEGIGVWRPVMEPRQIHGWTHSLTFEPRRDTIGMWVDSCVPHRMRIMDTLLASGLPVHSYGACKFNRDDAWRRQNIRLQMESDGRRNPKAVAACSRHRLMLAVENKQCRGWVAWNLEHALGVCKACPARTRLARVHPSR